MSCLLAGFAPPYPGFCRGAIAICASDVPRHLLTGHWPDLLAADPDLVIEVIGGTQTAGELINAARERGIAVTTANKQLLAVDPELLQATVASGHPLLKASASVGGGLPALEHTALISGEQPVTALTGVLNGTCNYVLDRQQEGVNQSGAIAEAQERGLAEADPHLDISGWDCVYKLSLLASTAFDDLVTPEEIAREGLESVSEAQIAAARERGEVLKLVAEARRLGGRIVAQVSVQSLKPNHPLAQCRQEANCLLIETASGHTHRTDGLGAGRWPTTCSILGDALDVRRQLLAPPTSVRTRYQKGVGS